VADRQKFQESGCELLLPTDSRRSERYVFLSDFNSRAVMNINGQDVELSLVRSKESTRSVKKGDRSSFWYAGDGIEARVDYVVTGLCPPDDESCEVIYYSATIHLTTRFSKRDVKAYGVCGS
jgi:hypothetical protein